MSPFQRFIVFQKAVTVNWNLFFGEAGLLVDVPYIILEASSEYRICPANVTAKYSYYCTTDNSSRYY